MVKIPIGVTIITLVGTIHQTMGVMEIMDRTMEAMDKIMVVGEIMVLTTVRTMAVGEIMVPTTTMAGVTTQITMGPTMDGTMVKTRTMDTVWAPIMATMDGVIIQIMVMVMVKTTDGKITMVGETNLTDN